jgi:hypothetical protein
MIITGSAIRPSLWSRGLQQDEDAAIRSRTPAYMDEPLFYEYLSLIFLPYVTAVRSRVGLQDQPAVLLMDSALPHVSERVRGILGENDVIAITFPAHTTNVFQALDLVFFGALKKLKATARGEIDDASADATILKLIQAYEQAAMSTTVRASFRFVKAGYVRFNDSCAKFTLGPFKSRS